MKGIYNFKNHTSLQKVSKLLFWRQKWVGGVRHGNLLVVGRVSPGRIVVVLFRTKYAVPRQIKPEIFKLTTSRSQSNLRTVFSFVSCEEKGCYRIVSSGHVARTAGSAAVCKAMNRPIDHFTVVCSVTWPLNGSEAGGDLVLIKTSLSLLCRSSYSYAN